MTDGIADLYDGVNQVIDELEKAIKQVAKKKSVQVAAKDERDYLKSVAGAWFNSHRPVLLDRIGTEDLGDMDANYQVILEASGRRSTRNVYKSALKAAKRSAIELRSRVATITVQPAGESHSEPPQFKSIVGDQQMIGILESRWKECQKCVDAGAHLAAIVMMGGMLEAMFVARSNILADKSPLIKAKSAPIDKKTGKVAPYNSWMLDSYIKVGHEIGWITASAKQVAGVLREYRNYVHPAKQKSHAILLDANDSSILWNITRDVVAQLLQLKGAV